MREACLALMVVVAGGACSEQNSNASESPVAEGVSRPSPSPVSSVLPPVNGTVRLGRAFWPDPQVGEGVAGGATPVAVKFADAGIRGCAGWVSEAADFRLAPQGPLDGLRVVVWSDADTTLAVVDPGGRVHCSDDAEGRNPAVTIADVSDGHYGVWVGSAEEGLTSTYRIGFSELVSTKPSHIRDATLRLELIGSEVAP